MKAAEAMAVAVRSVEVVMAVKGAAATVAAEEEVAREEAAEAEETVLYLRLLSPRIVIEYWECCKDEREV